MKKKILLVLTLILTLTLITGCKKEEKEETKVCGWEKDVSENRILLDDEVEHIFIRATSNEKEKYTPIALLGTQVVAGTNYMFLVTENSKEYKVMIIYNDLEGNAKVTSISPIDLEKYVNNEKQDTKEGTLSGGWSTTIPGKGNVIEIEADFVNAVVNSEKQFTPIAVLGHQVVAGTNYAVLTYGRLNEKEGVYVLTLYKDLEENSKILSEHYIDLGDFNK